ncbi:MAG: ABC transporter permease subunit [Mycoplasmatales bacterium]|nr:ABC transporter permease subunit [Mycoplasmatales bacterium]
MFKYTRYLLRSSFRKLSTIFIPLALTIVFGGTLGIQIANNESDAAVIDGLLAYYYLFPFVFGPLYVATKAITIFKDGEEDGTELIIVAKPIKRIKIIIGKFLALYAHILFFSVFIFLLGIIISLADTNASGTQKIKFAGSLFIGNLIITIIMSSVITFVASSFGKIATLVTAILIPFIFSITSFILSPLGNGQISSGARQENVIAIKEDGTTTYNSGRIYDQDGTTLKAAIEEQDKGWYKYVAYIDVYQQLIKFYSAFQTKNVSLINVTDWKSNSDNNFQNNSMQVNINGKDYSLLYFKPEGFRSKNSSGKTISNNIQDANKIYSNPAIWTGSKSWDTYDKAISGLIINMNKIGFSWTENTNDNTNLEKIPAFNYLLVKKFKDDSSVFNGALWQKPEALVKMGLYESDLKLTYYTETPWVKPVIVYVVWTIIAISLAGLVVYKYLGRDFK